mmetsp:Transcript_20368/g.32508  ORF Transcript_20368/g.32508 Transcript_20368/m.32508 type:complete len:98 (-) Transcript_20368:251-544(-)
MVDRLSLELQAPAYLFPSCTFKGEGVEMPCTSEKFMVQLFIHQLTHRSLSHFPALEIKTPPYSKTALEYSYFVVFREFINVISLNSQGYLGEKVSGS